MNALGKAGPLGAEIIPAAPKKGGAAPWERAGGGHAAPDDPDAQARARHWQSAAAQLTAVDEAAAAAREVRREERRVKKEEAERKAAEKLERTARRLYLVGFAALPFVWIVNIMYFWNELTGRGEEESERMLTEAEEALLSEQTERKARIRKCKFCCRCRFVEAKRRESPPGCVAACVRLRLDCWPSLRQYKYEAEL
jgi:Presenilin enhancer-2 subunit of gamma secretase